MRYGVPPYEPVPLGDECATVRDLRIRHGDMLTVELATASIPAVERSGPPAVDPGVAAARPVATPSASSSVVPRQPVAGSNVPARPQFVKRSIADDNSCLFNAVG